MTTSVTRYKYTLVFSRSLRSRHQPPIRGRGLNIFRSALDSRRSPLAPARCHATSATLMTLNAATGETMTREENRISVGACGHRGSRSVTVATPFLLHRNLSLSLFLFGSKIDIPSVMNEGVSDKRVRAMLFDRSTFPEFTLEPRNETRLISKTGMR